MRSVTGLLFSLLGSLEPNNTKKLVEIVDALLIEAIQLGSLVLLEFGVGPIGLRRCLKSPGRSRLTVRGPAFAPAAGHVRGFFDSWRMSHLACNRYHRLPRGRATARAR